MELLGPNRFDLQTTVGHHGHSINCGHYPASINCSGKKIIPATQEFLNAISMIPPTHLRICTIWSVFDKPAEDGSQLFGFHVDEIMFISCGGSGGGGGAGGWVGGEDGVGVFNAVGTLVYSNQATHAQSRLPTNFNCRHTSLTLVTHRTGADSPATYVIWFLPDDCDRLKSPNCFSKLWVSENDTYWKRHLIVCDLQTG